jgi:hypothetical protein
MTGTLVEKLGDVKLKVAASYKSTNTNAVILVQKVQILTLLKKNSMLLLPTAFSPSCFTCTKVHILTADMKLRLLLPTAFSHSQRLALPFSSLPRYTYSHTHTHAYDISIYVHATLDLALY